MTEVKRSPYSKDPARGDFAPDHVPTDQLVATRAALEAKVKAGTATTTEIESLLNLKSTRSR